MQNNKVTLTKIVGGGQALGTLDTGKKAFIWGALPGETVEFQITKKKSSMVEGIVTEVISTSNDRISPIDADSYLSTSPWQIASFAAETSYKAQLIDDAFTLHGTKLPNKTTVYSDGEEYHYRNKVEFSWWGDTDDNRNETLDLAFFRRGGKGKIAVQGTSLAIDDINILARSIRDLLHTAGIVARDLKTVLIRCDQAGQCVWQLYVKNEDIAKKIAGFDFSKLPALGGEVIYSDPRSPASKITKRIHAYGENVLNDTILSIPFAYATEGFFQVNIPVYEHALSDMKKWIPDNTPVIDMYSGVGTIGLTIGGENATLIEIDEHAVREMKKNIQELGSSATAILSASETALDSIDSEATIILDPPRAGLHADVISRLLEKTPRRIVYLSCNPVSQARDVAGLLEKYSITHHQGYNFFPRTPHIEHLVVLDLV
jgi:23S rRNA (uracil1939-C5)-methyltransferase